jgi:hypothetical protein
MLVSVGDTKKDHHVRRQLEQCIAFAISNAFQSHPENTQVQEATTEAVKNLEKSFLLKSTCETGTPAEEIRFRDLMEGDRFTAHGTLWTKLGPVTARKHGQAGIELGLKGYGYVGDSICSFGKEDSVVFVPVDC